MVVGRGSWVPSRGSWVPNHGSWVIIIVYYKLFKQNNSVANVY